MCRMLFRLGTIRAEAKSTSRDLISLSKQHGINNVLRPVVSLSHVFFISFHPFCNPRHREEKDHMLRPVPSVPRITAFVSQCALASAGLYILAFLCITFTFSHFSWPFCWPKLKIDIRGTKVTRRPRAWATAGCQAIELLDPCRLLQQPLSIYRYREMLPCRLLVTLATSFERSCYEALRVDLPCLLGEGDSKTHWNATGLGTDRQ